MRDMSRLQNGVGASKEFGFVSFVRHEDALAALRNLNNNPAVFGPERRPIVDFSIENRKALLARQKREEKSRTNNPNFKGDKKSDLLARQEIFQHVKICHHPLILKEIDED
jgi:nucleolar protein 4